MKKILILLVLSGLFIGNVCAKDDFGPNRRLKSGVWLKTGYNATFSDFLYVERPSNADKAAKFGWDFQLGTTFYIGPRIADKLRFGLDVAWIDFSFFNLNSNYVTNASDYFLNFFELGPIISVSPVSAIAFDCYFRVVPTYSLMYYEANSLGSTTSYVSHGYNTNGLVGVTFRAGVFATGLEINFGKMKYTDVDDSANYTEKLYINNLRILVGFKF